MARSTYTAASRVGKPTSAEIAADRTSVAISAGIATRGTVGTSLAQDDPFEDFANRAVEQYSVRQGCARDRPSALALDAIAYLSVFWGADETSWLCFLATSQAPCRFRYQLIDWERSLALEIAFQLVANLYLLSHGAKLILLKFGPP